MLRLVLKLCLLLVLLELTAGSSDKPQEVCPSSDEDSDVCAQEMDTHVDSSDSSSSSLVEDEEKGDDEEDLDDVLSNELDELIRLQQMKVEHLMKRGKGKKTSKPKLPDSPPLSASSAMEPSATNVESFREVKSKTLPQQHRLAFSQLRAVDSYMVPRFRFVTSYSIADHHLLRVPTGVSARDSKSFPRDVLLIIVVDTMGFLHILNEEGDEILRKNLNLFHKKEIVVTDVEPHSELGPIFVSGAADGSINVLSFIVEVGGPKLAVTVAEVSNFNIRLKLKRAKGEDLSDVPNLPYPTSIHLYNRGSQRGMGIYIGDSYCRFSIFMLNSTLVGRVAASAHSTSVSEKSGIHSTDDMYECGPGEERGLGKMSRIGQLMAIPVGKAIMLFHIARLYVPPRVCHGSNEVITEATFDLTSMTYLLATTQYGSLLTFNTKTKDERGKDMRCSLMHHVPGDDTNVAGDAQSPQLTKRKLSSLKGYFLFAESSNVMSPSDEAQSCKLSIFNSSDIKQNREGSLMSSEDISPPCIGSTLSIALSPKNLREKPGHTSSEVLVALSRDIPISPQSDTSDGEISTKDAVDRKGEIIVYMSLLLPVEVEDELAWLKWPMTVGGILIFVLFKLFGIKKSRKSNTSGGTYSKYGKYHKRYDDSKSSELSKLREKLSEIENSVSQIDSAGSDLLKKFTVPRHQMQ